MTTTPTQPDDDPRFDRLMVPDGRQLRHFAGTEDADYVLTPLVQQTQEAIGSLQKHRGVVVIDGPAGRGKTFTVDAAAHAIAHKPYWLDLTGNSSLVGMYAGLLHEITGEFPRTTRAWEMGHEVNELLSTQDCMLVIDEAQWAPHTLLRTVRSIYDQRDADFGLVLVGQGVADRLRKKEPGLASRTGRVVRAGSIPAKRIHPTMAAYHPLFANTDSTVIVTLNHHARGDWREWALILQTAKDIGIDPKKGMAEREARVIVGIIGKHTGGGEAA